MPRGGSYPSNENISIWWQVAFDVYYVPPTDQFLEVLGFGHERPHTKPAGIVEIFQSFFGLLGTM